MNTKKTIKTKKASPAISKAAAKKTPIVARKGAVKTKSAAMKKVAVKVAAKKVVKKKSKAIPAIKKNVEAKKIGRRKESNLKRVSYMALSVIFGLLLGTFVHLFTELVYMRKMEAAGALLQTHYFLGMASYLPSFTTPLFLAAGLIFGAWLGCWGWKLVYVERNHRMFRK